MAMFCNRLRRTVGVVALGLAATAAMPARSSAALGLIAANPAAVFLGGGLMVLSVGVPIGTGALCFGLVKGRLKPICIVPTLGVTALGVLGFYLGFVMLGSESGSASVYLSTLPVERADDWGLSVQEVEVFNSRVDELNSIRESIALENSQVNWEKLGPNDLELIQRQVEARWNSSLLQVFEEPEASTLFRVLQIISPRVESRN